MNAAKFSGRRHLFGGHQRDGIDEVNASFFESTSPFFLHFLGGPGIGRPKKVKTVTGLDGLPKLSFPILARPK